MKKKKTAVIVILVVLGVFMLFAFIGESQNQDTESLRPSNTTKDAPDDISSDEPAGITDLSNYLGRTLSDIEDSLGVEFVKNEDTANPQYSSHNLVYEKDKLLFVCYADSKQVVTFIRLLDSSKSGYNIYGITSEMEQSEACELLSDLGATQITETDWQCGDGTDMLTLGMFSVELEHNSQTLQDLLEQKEAAENFSYQFEDSIGAYYIGNSQIVEYISSSFAAVAYEFKQSTGYQAEGLNEKYDGRYMLASGRVSGVSSSGIIDVHCTDESVAKEGVMHIPSGDASITLVDEQESILSKLNTGDNVDVFARFEGGSRSGIFFADNYDLYDGVIIAINGIKVNIPYIEKEIPGITTYNKRNEDMLPTSEEETPSVDVRSETLIETGYYTITIPASWEGHFDYEQQHNSLSFFEKGSHDNGYGGYLFGISLLMDDEFRDLAGYYELGSLVSLPGEGELRPIFIGYIVITYPTEMQGAQYSEDSADTYAEMRDDIDAILESFTTNDGYALLTE